MVATRRRGRELEEAILRAAWSLFLDGGYAAVTMQQVAEDAGTSKPVLYRRWADRDALLGDAMGYGLRSLPLDVPDTGSLRGDLLAVMEQVNQTLVGLTAVMSVHLAGYYEATGTTPADLQDGVLGDKIGPLREILERAERRGQLDPARLTPRIASMPFDLMRAEIVTTMQPLPTDTLEEIVDTMFLPLVSPAAPRSVAAGDA